MKILDYSNPSRESYTISFQSSLLWESALGIAAITHDKLRDTLTEKELFEPVQSGSISHSLKTELETVHTHNTWKTLLQLLHHVEDHSFKGFQHFVRSLDDFTLRYYSLPYLNAQSEELLNQAAHGDTTAVSAYAKACEHIFFFPDYVRYICETDIPALKEHILNILSLWLDEIILTKQIKIEEMIHRDLIAKQTKLKTFQQSEDFVEYVTDGIEYKPEPFVSNVLLIPHFSYRPWTIVADLKQTKVFYYPIANSSIHPGDPLVPDRTLPLSYKALGDEARLKMVKLLFQGPKSLQELAVTLDMPKSTLHHHLTQLRSAKLVINNTSTYSLNKQKLTQLGEALIDYLKDSE